MPDTKPVKRNRFLDWVGGTRFLSVLILLWVPYMTALVWGFVLAAQGKPDWTALEAMTKPVMLALSVFVGAKTVQHITLKEEGT